MLLRQKSLPFSKLLPTVGAPHRIAPMSTSATMAGAAVPCTTATAPPAIVQYVVLRKDLWTDQGWPLGSIVAQACHASSAAMWESKEDPVTLDYCSPENIDKMTKVGKFRICFKMRLLLFTSCVMVQVVLEVKGEAQLINLISKLTEAGIRHKVWIEQPEGFPTCVATKPYPKSEIAQHFKKLNLCKTASQGKSSSEQS